MTRLHLLHTNDLHGHLTAAQAHWLAAEKQRLAPCLLLDSGDAVGSGNLFLNRRGEPMHELMSQAGYDAGALGNREFHLSSRRQALQLHAARFPLLCTNLVAPAEWGGVVRQVRLEPLPGLPIVVLGVLRNMVDKLAACVTRARFGEPATCVRPFFGAAAATIVLSHLGAVADRALAGEVAVDLILGGHSHTPVDPPEHVRGTWLTQNKPHAGSLTRLALDFADGRLQSVSGGHIAWPSDSRSN